MVMISHFDAVLFFTLGLLVVQLKSLPPVCFLGTLVHDRTVMSEGYTTLCGIYLCSLFPITTSGSLGSRMAGNMMNIHIFLVIIF